MIPIFKILLILFCTNQSSITEVEVDVNGVLDSISIDKRPYISTYNYYFNIRDGETKRVRHFQLTSNYEIGLFGNCHLDIGNEYQMELEKVNDNVPANNRNIYSKVMDCYNVSFNDTDFEISIDKFLSDKKKLKKFIKKGKFDDKYIDMEGDIYIIKKIAPCPSQDNRSHR